MKIIGEAAGGKLLIEATRKEVANIMGVYSENYLKELGLDHKALEPGAEINVSAAWNRLYWLERKGDEFKELRRACEEVLRETRRLQPVFKAIKGEPQDDAA